MSAAAPTAPGAALARLRRRLALGYAAGALVLLGLTAGLLAARDGRVSALGLGALGAAHAAGPAAQAEPLTGAFERRALNALLVPLLDDSEPLRWSDVALLHFCGPGTRVEVDGQPMVSGALVPATSFRVRWHIDRCWPLDYAAFELSGAVELVVFHEDNGLGAVVDARQLRIATARGTGQVARPFASAMALGGADPLPAP
jgi:hypothetical protein